VSFTVHMHSFAHSTLYITGRVPCLRRVLCTCLVCVYSLLKRLIILVHTKSVDPKTVELACMPGQGEKHLGLGVIWKNMRSRSIRKAELVAALTDSGIDLDAFISGCKRKFKTPALDKPPKKARVSKSSTILVE